VIIGLSIFFPITFFTTLCHLYGKGYVIDRKWWDEEESHWEKVPEYCCFVKSEQPQLPLHKEAANWMLKRMTTKGSGFPDVDYFIKGKFELLI
tara:strand:- start:152 stop:430 length:279 start_codon:yes stop_codon:yes gene_type:complete